MMQEIYQIFRLNHFYQIDINTSLNQRPKYIEIICKIVINRYTFLYQNIL
mgnify:CR=1 FL=1